MRAFVALVTVCVVGGTARADEQWGAQAGVGAGVVGVEPVSALDARGDLTWDAGEVGLGMRLRVVGDDFVGADWDEIADWVGVVRYLVVRNRAERDAARLDAEPDGWRVALAAGTLGAARVGTATLVDGLAAGAIADRRATGAHLRAGRGAIRAELLAADLARAGVTALAGEAPAGPVAVVGAVAIDPRAPVTGDAGMIDTAPLAAASIAAAVDRTGELWRARFALDLGWAPGLGAGAALVGSGERRRGRWVGRARIEAGAGTGGWIAAPFGPLYLRLRDRVDGDRTLLDAARAGDLGGVGGAISGGVSADELGAITASLRHRPGLGGELAARIALPEARRIQAAADVAWMPQQGALLAGAEARVELGRLMWSGVELARQYRAGDTMGLVAERPVWTATAWFGVSR